MTDIELHSKSPDKHVQPEEDSDSGAGAGANAGSREDMVFVATDPLSELVWSPHKGLSLNGADCNLADKKGFLWSMVLAPPQSITTGKQNDVETLVGGNFNSSQTVKYLDCQVSEKVKMLASPSGTKSVMPSCQTMCCEDKLVTGEGMQDLTKKEDQPILNVNHEDDQSDKKGKRLCASSNLQSTEPSRTRRKTTSSNSEKACTQGVDDGVVANSSSTKLSIEKFYPIRLCPESGNLKKETSSDPFEENRDDDSGKIHTSSIDIQSAYNNASKQVEASYTPVQQPMTSSCKNNVEMAPVIQGVNRITGASSNILEKGDSTSENGFKPLIAEGASVDIGITSDQTDGNKSNKRQEGVLEEAAIAPFEAFPTNQRAPLYQAKGKEKITSYVEVNAGILESDDDSHESVESCNNSTGLLLSGKRPLSFDQYLVIGNKKMKQTHVNSHSTSVQRHGSSFMNWISNMVKGSSKPGSNETTSLDLVVRTSDHEYRGDDQRIILRERNQQQPGCTSMGFGTVFKALYRPSMNTQDTRILNIDQQLGEGLKELEPATKTCDSSSIPVTCGEENLKLCEGNVIATENQIICGDGSAPSSLPDIPSANILVHENHKISTGESNDLLDLPCNQDKGGKVSYCSSFQNDLDFPSKEKETPKLCLSAPNKSSDSVISGGHSLGSLWITRFCPRVFDPIVVSSQCEQYVSPAVEGTTNYMKSIFSQNCLDSIKENNSCEDFQEPPANGCFETVNKEVQHGVVGTFRSLGSASVKEYTNQKFKSAINTTEPFKKFINSEALVSVFASRLEALRHIMTSEVEGNKSHGIATCIFCGTKGHKLQECSEITEPELDALLKKLDSYDKAEESSCLCIHCFQPNHWAIACPNFSLRKRCQTDGSSLLDLRNSDKIVHNQMGDEVTENVRNPPENMVCGGAVVLTVTDSIRPGVDPQFKARIDVNERVNETKICDGRYSSLKRTEKDLPGNNFGDKNLLENASKEFTHCGKQTRTSSSTDNVSKEYQITAFYDFVNRQIPVIPRGTFEAIKKLRLSRTDIFKWRRSPVSLFPLDGFFIRLRLQKWEKELGSTGYYVARINGGLREKSSGNSKVPLSVKIGGFKCLVEVRFVSNHEFLEDELLAWWCATLKSGGNLPSEKDLETKLQLRMSFGF